MMTMIQQRWKRNSPTGWHPFGARDAGCGHNLRNLLFFGPALLFLVSVMAVLCLRWIDPPTSAFMIRHWFSLDKGETIRYAWVDWEKISPAMRIAVVAGEDQKFPFHMGFDLDSISDAIESRIKYGSERGASTITQQVAKNLFLWPGRSFIRKGMEAYFTLLMESLLPKRRILEIYLNIAEFGESVYGVSSAAERFFRKPASRLTPHEAALLAAVLPSPKKSRPAAPSAYLRARVRWIQSQVAHLGGPAYLKGL